MLKDSSEKILGQELMQTIKCSWPDLYMEFEVISTVNTLAELCSKV